MPVGKRGGDAGRGKYGPPPGAHTGPRHVRRVKINTVAGGVFLDLLIEPVIVSNSSIRTHVSLTLAEASCPWRMLDVLA